LLSGAVKYLNIWLPTNVLENGENKQSNEFCTGWGESRDPSTLPAGLSAFVSHIAVKHPVGRKRLAKSNDS
jgi:hypothetical protein